MVIQSRVQELYIRVKKSILTTAAMLLMIRQVLPLKGRSKRHFIYNFSFGGQVLRTKSILLLLIIKWELATT